MAGRKDRDFWLAVLLKICEPVLVAAAQGNLRATMPVYGKIQGREEFTHLEAVARTLVGLAPWLETPCGNDVDEEEKRNRYAALARDAIDRGTDPDSPDYFNFSRGGQPIVDAAFLAHAILRAPTELWDKLKPRVKGNVVSALKQTRQGKKPAFNNWLLFSAMIETALFRMGEEWDHMRVDYALRQHEQWYVGDGMYADGPRFAMDYYNSFVIHPMMLDVLSHLQGHYREWDHLYEMALIRAQRYAEILERLIAPDGTYPPIGRSIVYRTGAFQLLAQMALMRHLPTSLTPAQVRCALTAVMKKTWEGDHNFDENGWLKIGVKGHQPGLGETYISTGSLYLCTVGFLPLGLPIDDAFWQDAAVPWTSVCIWSGHDGAADEALMD